MTHHSRRILVGGLAGGAAEALVVALYASIAGTGGWIVAESVSRAAFGASFSGPDAVLVGLTVHFALSLLIAACFVALLPVLLHRIGRQGVVLAAALALLGVWAMNFFAVLPAIAPEFVTMVPLWLSFLSKLSFGVVMGLVLVSPARINGWRRRTPA